MPANANPRWTSLIPCHIQIMHMIVLVFHPPPDFFSPTFSKIHEEQVGELEKLTFISKPQAWSESFVLLLTFNCSPGSWPSGETVKVSQCWLLAIWETSELDSEKTWWRNLRISFDNKASKFYNAQISIKFWQKSESWDLTSAQFKLQWCSIPSAKPWSSAPLAPSGPRWLRTSPWTRRNQVHWKENKLICKGGKS